MDTTRRLIEYYIQVGRDGPVSYREDELDR